MKTLEIGLELVLNENDINADINEYSDFVKSKIDAEMAVMEFETDCDNVEYKLKSIIGWKTSGVGAGIYVYCADDDVEQKVKSFFSIDFLNRCWEEFCNK